MLGLLAGYGVVILVALMARLPPLEKAIGTDRLARWHAIGGRYVITAVSGHVVFIVWGYRGHRARERDERDRHAADRPSPTS